MTSIGLGAFTNCTSLTSLEIGSSVQTIAKSAFAFCVSLTSVEIPSSVTTIGEAAFGFCYSLTFIALPPSVTTIGNAPFNYCTALEAVAIPSSVTSITGTLFQNCRSMETVYIDEDSYTYTTFSSQIPSSYTRYNYTYTVTFDANGGELSGGSTAEAYYGIAFTFDQTATLDGYVVSGWNTAADGSGTTISYGDIWTYLSSTEDTGLTLYAQWEVAPAEEEEETVDNTEAHKVSVAVIELAVLLGLIAAILTAAGAYCHRVRPGERVSEFGFR